jgi:FAD:protein FMN transferase
MVRTTKTPSGVLSGACTERSRSVEGDTKKHQEKIEDWIVNTNSKNFVNLGALGVLVVNQFKQGRFTMIKNVFLIICSIFILSSCGQTGLKKYEYNQFLMDTVFQVVIYTDKGGREADDTAARTFSVISNLELKYSQFITNSLLYRLNKNLSCPADPETLSLFRDSLEISRESGGAFDITVAPLMELWGFYNQKYRLPSAQSIQKLLTDVDYRRIHLTGNEIKMDKNTETDLGAILKGFAVDKAVSFLQAGKIPAGLVNAGGNLKVFGLKPGSSPWKIGIRHPRKESELYKTIELGEGTAISTSGDYERFFITNNIRYCHILDPKNGYPARNSVISVSVIDPSAERADYLSTTLFVLGPVKGMEFADKNRIPVLFILEKDGQLSDIQSKWWGRSDK